MLVTERALRMARKADAIHQFQPFNFIPIEPPRPVSSTAENYARRQHHFTATSTPGPSKMKALFTGSKEKASVSSGSEQENDGLRISLDARLPEPAILTCNKDVPLRLIVKRMNGNADWIYLQSLQVELIGHTTIRARDVFRQETQSWLIVSHSNMNVLLDSGNDPEKDRMSKDIIIDPYAWQGKPVPNSVAPTFDICNITRRYELQIRVGLGHGSNASKNVSFALALP